MNKRITAFVSLDAVEANFRAMKQKLKPGTQMIAVIKADGYGHGAVPIAHLIEDYDYIRGFAVAAPDEAIELREAGIKKPILILGPVFPEDYELMAAHEIRIPVMDEKSAALFGEAAGKYGVPALVHIPIDTGMSRIGLPPEKESVEIIRRIMDTPNVTVEGMFTHFARADETDRSPAYVQLQRFNHLEELLLDAGIRIPILHASNSAGIMRVPEAHFGLVRAGISIYGIYPSDEVERESMILQPVMSLKSHVTLVKDIGPGAEVSYGGTFKADRPVRLATIPVGYADGYPRQLSNKGWVLIRGQKAPIRGRVCMDQMMVDVTDIPGAAAGDEAVLLGRDAEEEITADTLGALSGRFPYEFVCCINKRVPRVYIHKGKVI